MVVIDAVPQAMASFLDVPRHPISFVLEGGSIDGNGAGSVLTTESCLLHPNRGSGRTRARCASVLEAAVQAESLIWLAGGIEGDDTDGHVDDLTRFISQACVVTVLESDIADANFTALADNRRRLEAMSDAAGRKLEIIELPTPGVLEGPEGRLPASYANFYFANQAVLVPVFGVDADREALAIFETAIKDRPVVPIPSQNLVLGLGAVHCLTQQEPAHPSSPVESRV